MNLDHHSPSSLVAFARCPRLWAYQYLGKLDKPANAGMVFGAGFGAGLPYARRGQIDEAMQQWKQQVSFRGADLLANDPKRTAEAAWLMFATAARDLPNSLPVKPAPDDWLPAANRLGPNDRIGMLDEIGFRIPLPGVRAPLLGYMDAVQLYEGEPVVEEWKTTSWVDERLMTGWSDDLQVLIYCWALGQLWPTARPRAILRLMPLPKSSRADPTPRTALISRLVDPDPARIAETGVWIVKTAKDVANALDLSTDVGYYHKQRAMCHPYTAFRERGYSCSFIAPCGLTDWREAEHLYGKRTR